MIIARFQGEYAYLSNFYYAPMQVGADLYPTVEHFFQACKTLDAAKREQIRHATTPNMAKSLGRSVILRPDWEEVKNQIMWNGLAIKFTTHDELRQKLCATYPNDLLEGNSWHDNFWGICFCARCPWQGRNRLGKLLVAVREELLNETPPADIAALGQGI